MTYGNKMLLNLWYVRIGDVQFVPQSNSPSLAFVDSNQRAIVKVDNTTSVDYPNKRNSVSSYLFNFIRTSPDPFNLDQNHF